MSAQLPSTSSAPAGARAPLPGLTPLPQYGVIRASGPDAVRFLQGQLSNDLTELHAQRLQLACYCTPQGRVLATLLAWRDGADVLMALAGDLVAPIAQRLSRYVLRAQVRIAADADLVLLGATHAADRAALLDLPSDAHPDPMTIASVPGGWCMTLRTNLFLVALTREAAAVLAARAPAATPAQWELARIRAGIPMVCAATQEAFVPQMLNLDELGAISFTKGCYPGQEVVARTQYRGEVKRRLFRLRLAQGTAAPGQEIRADDVAGTVVDAAASPQGGSELLAVLRVDHADGRPLRLAGADDAHLQLAG